MEKQKKEKKETKPKKKGGIFGFSLFNHEKKKGPTGPVAKKKVAKEVIQEFIASDIMSRNIYSVKEDDSLSFVVRLFNEKKISGAPVIDRKGNFIGVISEKNVIKYVGSKNLLEMEKKNLIKLKESVVKDIMERNPITVFEHTPVNDVDVIMAKKNANRVVVVDSKKKAVGVISRIDLVRLISKQMMTQILKKNPHPGGSKMNTDIDKVLELVEKKGAITTGEVKKILGVPENKIEDWANILESHGLIDIFYSPVGKPQLRKKVISDAK